MIALASAELYDSADGSWTTTGSLADARYDHTATLLPNGKVFVAGGFSFPNTLASAELYDPASETWTATGSLATARGYHKATLLHNGKVLVAGGDGVSGVLASAELYDPATGTWTVIGSLTTERYFPTATLLPNGEVLVAGGLGGSGVLASAELYDPASGTWTLTGSLAHARFFHTATLLPNGKVLVVGDYNNGTGFASTELYDVGLGFSSDRQPVIDTATLRRASGNRLFLTGSLFQGISQASGGNTQDSSTNYPFVQLRSLDSSQVVFLPVDPVGGWSDTSFTSIRVRHFPFGPAHSDRLYQWHSEHCEVFARRETPPLAPDATSPLFPQGNRDVVITGVMASLLAEFKGKVDLIYIDPPFDVGADFTMDVSIGNEKETVGKDQSTLEMVANRDMWGKGTDSYLHMMYERFWLMKELLSENGTPFVHCDQTMEHFDHV